MFAAESLAVVFLDGAHDEAAIRADLAAWLPKVRPGGLLCGHDRNEDGVHAALKDLPLGLRFDYGPGSLWYVRLPDAQPATIEASSPDPEDSLCSRKTI